MLECPNGRRGGHSEVCGIACLGKSGVALALACALRVLFEIPGYLGGSNAGFGEGTGKLGEENGSREPTYFASEMAHFAMRMT